MGFLKLHFPEERQRTQVLRWHAEKINYDVKATNRTFLMNDSMC